MSWNVDSLPGQTQTQGSDASTVPPAAPDRSQLNTEGVIAVQTSIPQQGVVATQNDKPDYSGISPNAIAFVRWW